MRAQPPTIRTAAALALAALAACSSDFTPRSVLTDLRVLAIEAAPSEAGPDEELALTAVRYVPCTDDPPATCPPGKPYLTEERWTFCPFSIGAAADPAPYACAVDCETDLPCLGEGPGACATTRVAPGRLALACAQKLLDASAAPPGLPSQVPDVVTTIVRYVARSSDGLTREAVARIPLYTRAAPAPRNQAPKIDLVSIGDVVVRRGDADVSPPPALPPLARGAELTFRVVLTADSAEPYPIASGETVLEAPVVSFFTTDGRFDHDRGNAPDASVELKYEHVASPGGQAQLWAVATDLRGGVTVAGPYAIAIGP